MRTLTTADDDTLKTLAEKIKAPTPSCLPPLGPGGHSRQAHPELQRPFGPAGWPCGQKLGSGDLSDHTARIAS